MVEHIARLNDQESKELQESQSPFVVSSHEEIGCFDVSRLVHCPGAACST